MQRETPEKNVATKRIREFLCQFTDGNDIETGTSADFAFCFVLVQEQSTCDRFAS